jgi:integrase/recombinase XerD
MLNYSVLRSYYNYIDDNDAIKLLEGIKLPHINQVYRDVFDKDFLMLKTHINDYDDVTLALKKNVVRFLFETGIRAHEINNIIERNTNTLKINGKGNKIREIFHKNETTQQIVDKLPILYGTIRN